MHLPFSPVSLALLSSLVSSGAFAGTFHLKPFSDPGCKTAINATYDGSPAPEDWDYFNVNNGVSNPLTPSRWWDNTDFPGATLVTGSSAYSVWWKAEKDEDNCRIALMTEYSQWHYGQLGGPLQPQGNVIINAGRDGGCYYSSIPQGATLIATFCCGTGDCAAISAGNDALLLKRDVSAEEEKPSPESLPQKQERRRPVVIPERPLATKQEKRRSDDIPHKPAASILERDAHSYSPAALAKALVGRDGCTADIQSGPWPAAGYQTLVGNTQTCGSASCSFIINRGISLSSTLTSTTDQTITNSVGASVDTTAGSDLLGFSVTVGVSYEFAIAIGKSTSEAVQNGTTFSVSNNLGQALGTTAFASFTPTYTCYGGYVDCGHGKSDWLDFCTPAISDDGTTALGDYNIVYI